MAPPTPATGQALFLYGTLMRGFPAHEALDLPALLEYIGPAVIHGELYNLGRYPGLRYQKGAGPVDGELYRVTAERAFSVLDDHEGYDPGRPDESLFRRVHRDLVAPSRAAWVYVYNRALPSGRRIESGSWRSPRDG